MSTDDWWAKLDCSRGLTGGQLRALVLALGAKVDQFPDDDYYGGISGGCEYALDTIIELLEADL